MSDPGQQRPVVAGLLAEATALVSGEVDAAEAVPRLVALLNAVPSVRRAVAVPSGPGGTLTVEVEVDPRDAADNALVRSLVALVDAVCARPLAVVPDPRSGIAPPVADRSLVVLIDDAGVVSASPEAMRDVLGHPVGTVPGDGLATLLHPEDLPVIQRAFDSLVLSPEGQIEVDVRARHADGRWVVLQVGMVNLLERADVRAIVAHGQDVTAERRAEEQLALERARLRELVAHLDGGVVVDDGHLVILDNTAFRLLFDGARGVLGSTVDELVDLLAGQCADPPTVRDRLTEASRSGEPHHGVRLELANGRVAVCDVVALRARRAAGTFWYFRDITGDEELEATNRALARAAELKSRFVATVSHELRTPLTAVLAFGELLASSPADPLTDGQAAQLAVVNRNARRLLRLVDDLLLLSRLETNRLTVEWAEVDVAGLVEQVVADHVAMAGRDDVRVEVSAEPGGPVRGDAARLTQVLDNVLGNALKFTPSGGEVRVTTAVRGARWTVSVADTGIGIPAADLPTLFDPFTRGSNAGVAGVPGSGLGLSICRQIVALHHGSITVESSVGVGTTIHIGLPVAPGKG